jgi:hypothetical protein
MTRWLILSSILWTACGGDSSDAPSDASPPEVNGDMGACADCEKTVFVTSERFAANFGAGGLASADAKCQTAAQTAGLSGTFRAWLSDQSASVLDRFTHAEVPYVRVDGQPIATSWTALTTADLEAPINVTEYGQEVVAGPSDTVGYAYYVFTSTYSSGNADDSYPFCDNWTSTQAQFVSAGDTRYAESQRWSWGNLLDCSLSMRLFCFEQ